MQTVKLWGVMLGVCAMGLMFWLKLNRERLTPTAPSYEAVWGSYQHDIGLDEPGDSIEFPPPGEPSTVYDRHRDHL